MRSSKVIIGLALLLTSLSSEARRDQRREVRQQGRIQQGVNSGQLTRGEARRLEKGEARIDRAQAKAESDGVVTGKEKVHLEHMQNVESRRIFRQKHDAQVQK